jgi:integrase
VPLSVKTVRNVLVGSLRAMLRRARKDGLLSREQFADLVELEWPKAATPEPDPFTAEERTRLLAWFEIRTFRVPADGYVLRLHPAYHVYLHVLFWSGMRPSEAAGLQWQDVDLGRATVEIRRSRHLRTYGEPKTKSGRRTVQLFPETVDFLRRLQPLRVEPTAPVFPHTRGGPIEPNALLPHWYAAQRACGIRVRGLYSTKDTFVSTALDAGVTIAWLEQQTGVTYATLRKHYGKWMPGDRDHELRRFAELAPGLFPPESKLEAADFCARAQRKTGTAAKFPSDFAGPMMRKGGLEPPRVFSPQDPEGTALPPSSGSAASACAPGPARERWTRSRRWRVGRARQSVDARVSRAADHAAGVPSAPSRPRSGRSA